MMGPGEATTRCPACGADVVGSPKFCKSCGTRLPDPSEAPTRVEPAAPEPAAPEPAPVLPRPQAARAPGAPPAASGPPRWALVTAAVVALAAVCALLFVVLSGDDSSDGDAARQASAPSKPQAPAAETPPQAVADEGVPTETEVRQLLDTYSERYGAEDALGLGELFAADAVRENEGDPPEDRAEAIANYREQFARVSNPTYTLSDIAIARDPGKADVRARYTIASGEGTVTGGIRFVLVDSDGHLVIQRLSITPD